MTARAARRGAAGGRKVLRVALVADTHGSVDARVAAVARRCDVVVHAGDIGARSVLRALAPPGGKVHAVRGNNDIPAKWPPAEQGVVRRLRERLCLPLPGGVLAVEHGDRVLPASRRHAKLRRRHPEARAIVYGHTHRLVCDTAEVAWVLNPGAAGRIRNFGGPSCLLLCAGSRRWTVRLLRFEIQPAEGHGSSGPQLRARARCD